MNPPTAESTALAESDRQSTIRGADRRARVIRRQFSEVIAARTPSLRAKRTVDFLFAAVGAGLSAPLWLAIAVAIKLDDGGPVFYRQQRWGKLGRQFHVLKFRTMVTESDEQFGIRQASQGDIRITRVGRILRATGMDELPQLLSILKGDMSLVGPRALAVGEAFNGQGTPRGANSDLEECTYANVPGFYERLSVLPGLTSLATVYLPKDVDAARKFRYDVFYVRRRTLVLDVKLILHSFWISVSGRWEKVGKKGS